MLLQKIIFINLGEDIKENEFEEYHYKILAVAERILRWLLKKPNNFYKHCSFDEAISHIDDKYGIDVDISQRR
jgi:hypothetical protein